jgi:hypothetical protein
VISESKQNLQIDNPYRFSLIKGWIEKQVVRERQASNNQQIMKGGVLDKQLNPGSNQTNRKSRNYQAQLHSAAGVAAVLEQGLASGFDALRAAQIERIRRRDEVLK